MSNVNKSNEDYEIVNPICAGIDIHRDLFNVTLLISDGYKTVSVYRKYRSVKKDIIELRNWLLEKNCPVVGLESTGKYWLPLLNALEGYITVNLYNARHMKNIPGKKTDRADSKWIARATRHALLMPSFIPDAQTRDSRCLVRTRKSLVEQRTRVRQIIHGILDTCSIRISSFISDIHGVSGTHLLDLITEEKHISREIIEKQIHGKVKKKAEDIYEAMQGYIRPAHIYTLKLLRSEERFVNQEITNIELKLKSFVLDTPEKTEVFERLLEVPGFAERSAILLLAEIGFDLSSFPTHKNFASWAGLAPGKKESAGVNKSGRIQVRQHYLRSLLVEVGYAASRSKDTFYNSKFYSLKVRMITQKAIVAIAHKLAVVVYKIIKEGKSYQELSPNYVSCEREAKDLKYLKRLTERMDKDAIIQYLESITKPTEP